MWLENRTPTPENPISFRFAIIVSAFPPSPPEFRNLLEDRKESQCPTLFTWGEADNFISNEWSKELSDYFPNAEIYKHHGGHYVPATSEAKELFQKFISQFQEE